MQTRTLTRVVAMAVFFVACTVSGQEGIEPMGGVGGEMRRVENQAVAPAVPKAADKTPLPALPPLQSELENGAQDKGQAWNIRVIALTGDIGFAEDMGIRASVIEALVGGTPKTEAVINEALKKIFDQLVESGYYLAGLSLSRNPYDEKTQTLTVRVGAGFLGGITVGFTDGRPEGRWFSKNQLTARFDDFQAGEVFDYRKLYSKLSEVNAHPDLTLNTKITVRKELEGEGDARRVVRYADLGFTAQEKLPFHAIWDINNFGTESIGEWQSSLILQYLNLTKADDVLTVSPSMSLDSSMFSLAGSYMRPHSSYKGGATTLYAGWSELDSKDIVPRIDLEGTGWFVGLMQSYRLIDDPKHLLSCSVGIVHRYIEDQFSAFGTPLQRRDVTVTPLTLAFSYSARRPDGWGGRNFATFQTVYNLAVSGRNSLREMWVGADDHYLIGRLQMARIQPLFGRADAHQRQIHQWILFMKAEGQYASGTLIPAEKLFLGGHNTVRGYTTKGYLGDNGIYGTVELRTPILLDLLGKTFGRKPSTSPLDRLQFVAFADAGYMEAIDPLPGATESETLLSVGAGLRMAITQYSQLRFDVGLPVTSTDTNEDSAAYYLNWQAQF